MSNPALYLGYPEWYDPKSLKEAVQGMIAICSFSTLSNLVVMGTFIWIYFHKYTNKTTGRLVLNLLFADWIQSIGYMMSYYWISQDGNIKSYPNCNIQGMLINIGGVASGCWAFTLCLQTYLMVVHSYDPKWLFTASMMIIWPFNIILSTIGTLIQNPHIPFYSSAGGAWCWINAEYSTYRLIFHYGIITVLAVSIYLLYGRLIYIIYRRQATIRTEKNQTLKKNGIKLLLYPGAHCLITLPLALHRLMESGETQTSFSFLIIAGCIAASSGLVNSLIYGMTRSMPSTKPIFEIVPKFNIRVRNVQIAPSAIRTVSISSNASDMKPLNMAINMPPHTAENQSHQQRMQYRGSNIGGGVHGHKGPVTTDLMANRETLFEGLTYYENIESMEPLRPRVEY
ncbi:hypothetical protein G9A89_002929 [Geosiphon pyriformis]|nr:hypothetical protein G9A89_002929 [Geosiphon pyriformis]